MLLNEEADIEEERNNFDRKKFIMNLFKEEYMSLQFNPDYLDDLLVRMAHHSTAIEGNTLSQGDTKSILLDNYLPRAMDLRELNEVLNYKKFMPFLTWALEEKKAITVDFIKDIHRILCADAIEAVPGRFKVTQNMIVGANFTPTQPYMVIPELENWRLNLEAMLSAAQSEEMTVEAICLSHIQFEKIHPFPDGNGRVGRALMVYSSLTNDLPPIIILKTQKNEYINYLNNEDLIGFKQFCLNLVSEERSRQKLFDTQYDNIEPAHQEEDPEQEW